MRNYVNRQEIDTIFNLMGLPLIDKGIDDIRDAKDSFGIPRDEIEPTKPLTRTILSDGTGGRMELGENNNAKLESGSI